jgi:hypothetical protein
MLDGLTETEDTPLLLTSFFKISAKNLLSHLNLAIQNGATYLFAYPKGSKTFLEGQRSL